MATKTFKVSLSLDNPRNIQSGINVRSFDKQSIKIAIELIKDSQVYQIPTDAQIKISLLKLARQEQKIILDVPFTSAEAIEWIVPEYLDGYQGDVRVGVYLLRGSENIDAGYFNITSKVSDIDKAAEEFTDDVMEGWNQLVAPEVIVARNGKPNLKTRIDDLENETNAQLAQTAKQSDLINTNTNVQNLTSKKVGGGILAEMADLSQEVKEGMTGGSVAVVGEGGITEINLANDVKAKFTTIEQKAVNKLANLLVNSNVETTIDGGVGGTIHIKPDGTFARYSGYSTSYQNVPVISGHKYYVSAKIATDSIGKLDNICGINYSDGTTSIIGDNNIPIDGVTKGIITADKSLNANFTFRSRVAGTITRINQMVIDITEVFGAGFEPTQVELENILSYFSYWLDSNEPLNNVQITILNELLQLKRNKSSDTHLLSGEMKILNRNKDKFIVWYDTKRKIVYATDNVLPISARTKLYASYDKGKTWDTVYVSTYGINKFITLSSGYHIATTSNSRINRISPNFGTTQMWLDSNVVSPLSNALGFAESNGVIMFCEYGTTVGTLYRIWKSTDDGLTWAITHDGTGVRHWHSIQVDPYTGYFWACAGDSDAESQILLSDDGGVTWQTKTTGSQSARAVGLVFYSNEVVWGMDTAGTVPKIYKANKTNFIPVEIGEVPLRCTTLGITKTTSGLAMGWTRVESNSNQRDTVVLWSTDRTNVKIVARFSVKTDISIGTSDAGFTDCTLADNENYWFANLVNCDLNGALSVSLPLN